MAFPARSGRCGACGYESVSGARFCERCGARLRAPAVEGERRQLTAMYCDVVGYTALAQRLDPEEVEKVLATYQQACGRAIGRFEGHIAQFLGDGVLAYFGFPQAHEDDAERAVRAALAIQAELRELAEAGAEAGPLQARIGLHTGPVVVTEIGNEAHHETLALGHTINVAARIQALAEPGGVAVSDTTLRLVPGLFVTRDMGTPELKGVSEKIRVRAVLSSAGLRTRFGATRALTPLTGRDSEIDQLMACWEEAAGGRGQVCPISGEPGIGKSRLLHALVEELAEVPHFTLELSCSPYTAGSAFQPVVSVLELGLEFAPRDTPDERLAKLETGMERLEGLVPEQVIPYLGALLALPPSPRFPLEPMAPELQREKTLDALAAPILALAARQPVLIAAEDLHWSDPSTLELLGRLIERAPGLPILVVLTFRPEFESPWTGPRPQLRPIGLSRLLPEETRRLVEAACGGAGRLASPVVDQIVERSDGVPLFAEELTRSVTESADATERVGTPTVPMTLQDSLMARLDQLQAAKRVAQFASTLGRHFSYALIEAISDLEGEALRSGLEELVEAQILYQRGAPPEATYLFKHALLQDTAYESQLKSRRRTLHARIAETLQSRFPQQVAAQPERMARHCAEGGLGWQAVSYYQQAGEQAVSRLSNAEAVEYFSRGLEHLSHLADDGARRQKEIEVRLALGGPLAALRGYDDPEGVRSCERVEALCEAMGEGPQQLGPLLGLTLYHVNRGHLPRARDYAESLLRVLGPDGVPALRVAGHMIRGTASIPSATITEACRDLETAIEIARSAELPPPQEAFRVDALTVAYSTYAIALVVSGRPDQGVAASERALARARELGHVRTLASALVNSSMAFHLSDEPEATRTLTRECLELVTGRGFHSVECSARVQDGWARARLGDLAGIEAIEEGLDRANASGALGGLSQLYFTAAETYKLARRFDRAFAALEAGEKVVERTGEWMGFKPQGLLVRAGLLVESGGSFDEAERLLLESIELWRRNHSTWLELRAVMLLARIAPQTGRTPEARERLEALVSGFREGFGTRRLREARTLLESLS